MSGLHNRTPNATGQGVDVSHCGQLTDPYGSTLPFVEQQPQLRQDVFYK
jgi:hypothetical protein